MRYATVISEEIGRQLKRYYPAVADKAEIIQNCVDEEFVLNPKMYGTRTGKARVLQVETGRNKNVERATAAMADLPVQLRTIGALSDV